MELNEFLIDFLKDAGFGGVDVQKTPIGTRITLYVTRPGLVIGRKGSGIKDLTSRMEEKFGLSNPQISVMEVETPELNPKIMANRICQLIERGTAFRRAAMWSMNTIMNTGALGVEVTVAGKLRSERSHFEKHSMGIVPKSGNVADQIVKIGITHVLTKMGLLGIQVRISLKNEHPSEFELLSTENVKKIDDSSVPSIDTISTVSKETVVEETISESDTSKSVELHHDNKENSSVTEIATETKLDDSHAQTIVKKDIQEKSDEVSK
ncbi:MAG: 30S ribosomal protein S3 [Nitrososphaeraceae archaeon]|nr:30S ribosomal protein S3 [Nitrososphaeraceae archaeon]